MFKAHETRSSHYVETEQGRKHDADISKLETGHKRNMDLGKNTVPDQDSHNPDQSNYEGTRGDWKTPTRAEISKSHLPTK